MQKFTFYACLIILLSGCGGRLCHPTKGKAEFEHDKYECEILATQIAHDWGSPGNPFIIADETNK